MIKPLLIFTSLVIGTVAFADDSILSHAEREIINDLASKPLNKQAEYIRKKVNVEVLKSNKNDHHHFFDFLGEGTKSIDEISDLEGLYGKVQCSQDKITPILYISDDAPPSTLLHEFIHFYEQEQTPRWCALEGRVLETDERKEKAVLYHRFEFEALKTLFEIQSKLTMNFEDKLIILDGLNRENKVIAILALNPLDEKTLQTVNRELEVLHSQMSYITWLSRTPEDAGSVLEKMEILNLRSCVENSKGDDVLKRVNECVAARRALSKIKYRNLESSDLTTPTHDPLLLVISAWTKMTPDLYDTCPITKLRDEFQDHLQEPTSCWKRVYSLRLSSKNLKLTAVKEMALISLFNAPLLNVDKKISFQKANTPQSFIQKAYCYSVFQKSAGYGAIPVDQFAYATQGVTIDFSQVKNYRNWLDDKEGQACEKLVTIFAGNSPSRFEPNSENKKYMLIINPLAALGGGLDGLKHFLALDINHERLHIIFAENKDVRKNVKGEWTRLSPAEKSKFKNGHPQYDFSEEDIALREYFAYSHQDQPRSYREGSF
jgi:hypothetical protein